MSIGGERIEFRSCPLCEATCGLTVELEDGHVRGIRGDPEDPLSRGHVCPKAVALVDVQGDPDRLRHPVRRTAGGWERVGWDEALDEAADRLGRIQKAHGRNAVAVYQGNPTVHNYGTMLFAPDLVRALGTRNRFSATSVDQLPHHVAADLMFGHPLLTPVPDVDRTDFLLILGANPLASGGSLMTAPGAGRRLEAIRARGGRVVLVDPRRTETARAADQHHFIRPGTDALLLMALLNTLFKEGLDRLGRLTPHVEGLPAVRALVAEATPERASRVTGIPADTVRTLARDFARAPSAACYGRFGVSTQAHGSVCQWLINVLNLATGNLDHAGGAMFTRPAVDPVGRAGRHRRPRLGRWASRVRGLPEAMGELPVSALAEEILTLGEGRVRGLLTSAGNPVLSTPNGRRLDRALAELQFMVSIDFYVNETTRHAHLILPPTAPLEHPHYDLAFGLLSVRNVAKYSPALLPSPEGALHDWEIYLGLESRLRRGLKDRVGQAVRRRLGPDGLLDLALRTGPHGAGFRPFGDGLTLRRLKDRPHGIDLGPLEPVLPERLRTADGRLHAAPPVLLEDAKRALAKLEEAAPEHADDALLLIGRRDLRSNNSWMHNFPRLVRGRDRCTLLIHPEDAAARGIADGGRVRVASRVGEVEVRAEHSDTMMPGVVSLPHGWGHDRPGVLLSVARAHPGASANDLTDERHVDRPSGNAVLNGVPVRVAPAGA